MFWVNMVQRLNLQKHLGLIVDSKFTFNQHLKEKICNSNNGILMIRKLYRYLPRSTLLTVYKSFIRPHLDYCDIIYHKPCNDHISMNTQPKETSLNLIGYLLIKWNQFNIMQPLQLQDV